MPTQPDLFFRPALVPEQEFLSGPVPTVYGPIEHREWKGQLERIHEMLRLSGVEETFQRLSLAQRNSAEQRAADTANRPFYKWGTVEQESYQRLCSQALRCTVARTLMGESLRGFGCRLAESALLQWFYPARFRNRRRPNPRWRSAAPVARPASPLFCQALSEQRRQNP